MGGTLHSSILTNTGCSWDILSKSEQRAECGIKTYKMALMLTQFSAKYVNSASFPWLICTKEIKLLGTKDCIIKRYITTLTAGVTYNFDMITHIQTAKNYQN